MHGYNYGRYRVFMSLVVYIPSLPSIAIGILEPQTTEAFSNNSKIASGDLRKWET